MPLELSQISQQIQEMTAAATSREYLDRLALARLLLRQADPAILRERMSMPGYRTSWLVAQPWNSLTAAFPLPPVPDNFTVVAADGSAISPDRHSPVRYYVINTGRAVLSYGAHPQARLDAQSQLYFREEDLYIPRDRRTMPIEGPRLAVKMAVEELQALWSAAQDASRPVVAIRDGSLILWGLQVLEQESKEELLEPVLACLEAFRAAHIPVISYISLPDGKDVVNALRVWRCTEQPVDCDRCRYIAQGLERICAPLANMADRLVFDFLKPGQRSDIFGSTSTILEDYGPEHRVGFFYLRVNDEIARIETPEWVLRDHQMLDLVHAVIYDQCQRGRGYPPALVEAHEKAVISNAERRVVEEMVERALARHGIVWISSGKEWSKRERGV